MVRIEEHKYATQGRSIQKMPLPQRVYIPLHQHLGKECAIIEVKPGERVLTGQRIATAQAHVYAPVHSSVSGSVYSIQDWPHPVLGRAKAIAIDSDGRDEASLGGPPLGTKDRIDKLTPEEIKNAVLEAGIVGMGGAGFPAHIKLAPPKPADTLIINGAECEPYLTGDYRLMLERAKEILLGAELAARCLGAQRVYIAIEDNKPLAIKEFLGLGSRFSVKVLKTAYPQGGEKQLIKNVLGKEVPAGKLPFDIGVVVHSVATVFAIYEAVYLRKPLYERVVTVTGSGLTRPGNLVARVGTPIKDLIAFLGPLAQEPAKIIIGGPMMGIAQYTDEVPVIKTTTGVILISEGQADLRQEEFCIRCGACVRACPSGLAPCLINLASEKKLWPQAKAYGALDCIECGLCSYVCPANRIIVQSIKRAKMELTK